MIEDGAIAVYPERVAGNPWRARTVVRYLLHEPGYFGGPTEYDDSELIYAFSRLVLPKGLPDDRVLWVPTIETRLFNAHGLPPYLGSDRSKDGPGCFYVGKGRDLPRVPETEGMLELTLENAPTRKKLAGILRSSRILYTYDDYTLLIWEARMCGCPVVVVPSHVSKERFGRSEYGLNGIAWGGGGEAMQWARSTVELAGLSYYLKTVDWGMGNVAQFLKTTQEAAESA